MFRKRRSPNVNETNRTIRHYSVKMLNGVLCVDWIDTYGFANAHLCIEQALQYYFIVISLHYCRLFWRMETDLCSGIEKLLGMSTLAADVILSLNYSRRN